MMFETNSNDQAVRVLKYLNCLHELCVTATAAAAAVDRAWERIEFNSAVWSPEGWSQILK